MNRDWLKQVNIWSNNSMTRSRLWAINIMILVLLLASMGIIYRLTTRMPSFMLSCSSELFHRKSAAQDRRHYLLVDLVSNKGQAQINYRYFDYEGNLAGTLSMKGTVDRVDTENQIYDISVTTKKEFLASHNSKVPQHLAYSSYVSSLNLNKKGLHSLSLQVIERDEVKDYAVVLFQPSNTVCGCRLVH
jgi:hypothetical protein